MAEPVDFESAIFAKTGSDELVASGRPSADPSRLAIALLSAVDGGILLTQVHRDLTFLETAINEVLERIESQLRRPRDS